MVDAIVAGAGVDLAVREFGGSGTPVLLLHGAGNTLVDMAPLASHLAVAHRVVGMDLRDHGRSGDGPWEWDAVLADVHAVIQGIELINPIIVGHSLGGILAAMYAQRCGGVTAAVNLDGYGNGTSEPPDMEATEVIRLRALLRSAGELMIRELSRPRTHSEVAAAREAWVAGARVLGLDPALATEAFDRKLVESEDGTFTTRPQSERLVQMSTAIDDLDVLALYRESTVPQLVYIAVDDRPNPNFSEELRTLAAASQRGLRRQLHLIAQSRPSVQVIEVNATHGLIYECPELIAHQIRDYAHSLAAPAVAVATPVREQP